MRPTSHVPPWLLAVIIASAFAASAVVGVYLSQFKGGLSADHSVWGTFGDYVGGVLNPLFAMLAFFAVLYTILLQSRELRESSEQLRKAAAAADKQNAVLEKQAFEQTYFQLLRLQGDLVSGLTLNIPARIDPQPRSPDSSYSGRQCLEKLAVILTTAFLNRVERGDDTEEHRAAVAREYSRFYREYGHLVGHYFRTIYSIVKFVDRSSLEEESKQFYVSLVRAQLSRHELCLLFYNCVFAHGREKFLPLVRKYRLLKHLEDGVLSGSDGELYRGEI